MAPDSVPDVTGKWDPGPIAPGAIVLDPEGLDRLISTLWDLGFRTLGPTVADGVLAWGEVRSAADLPRGWHDDQAPGHYRLVQGDDGEYFGWAVGAHSPKRELVPPSSVIWRASLADGLPRPEEEAAEPGRATALLGVRPCEVAAVGVLDRVLAGSALTDPGYRAARDRQFICTVECGSPSGNCFCDSMGSGPEAGAGFDVALTELLGPDEHRFLARAGSERGVAVLERLGARPAGPSDLGRRQAVLEGSRARMGRRLETRGLPQLLERNLEHPRWNQVAQRCLACGNCTEVCPTCFCVSFEDLTDLHGQVLRRRRWASCFEVGHSYVHGGAVRGSTRSRYRQWMTHKLGSWWDQFGTAGCVGCGRCITWCPVGIDITEEAAAIRADDRGEGLEGANRGA